MSWNGMLVTPGMPAWRRVTEERTMVWQLAEVQAMISNFHSVMDYECSITSIITCFLTFLEAAFKIVRIA